MKKYFFISALAVTALLGACNQSHKQESSTEVTSVETSTEVAANDTAKVYEAYLVVKDALVQTDGKAAQQAATKLTAALSPVKGCDEAEGLSKKIAETDDIKSQRTNFLQLSQDVIPLVKGLKTKSAPIYVAYCPMANEGNGGYWLSAQKEIKNPYYGKDMMDCGEVKEEIK
ncbi:DUF3347 domain-containing protein [uncultured Mucilaginibacter sp.]|uniref:DUF3347 domain-containing protein n=1 Tax=uncultured Mucilaginibacter sp. TaxID=797541 RepID=UPI0025D0F595|nr:DUF3347 domain-containing protein [uncultured Mucilaginibacter sp.]